MKLANYFIYLIILLLVFCFDVRCVTAKKNVMSKEFTFYKVGQNDNFDSTIIKMQKANFKFIKGKAISLETSNIPIKDMFQEIPKKVQEILKMDKKLHEWDKDTKVVAMPINVLNCEPIDESAFMYCNLFFSDVTGNLLGIYIKIDDYNLVKNQLMSKYGKCAKRGYCTNNYESILMFQKTDLIIFYNDKIKEHYKKINKSVIEKKTKARKNLKKAF